VLYKYRSNKGTMPFGFLKEYNGGKKSNLGSAKEWAILKG
jgi:hypothetical protein